MNKEFYLQTCYKISELITKRYSTSFSLAVSFLEKEQRSAIYAIYGFVRLADEIVDSFHPHDKIFLLNKLTEDLYYSLGHNISTNTVLMAFADTVNKYKIPHSHINAFLESMKRDLNITQYHKQEDLSQYIYGSADVVGLMCLRVFCHNEPSLYQKLELPAQKLGSAFQKVNFLRDIKSDTQNLGRYYFPEMSTMSLNQQSKKIIEHSIEQDFKVAFPGIRQLPGRSKLAVAIAYYYYNSLFIKIIHSSPEKILSQRIRISNIKKYLIMVKVCILYFFKRI
ncbi:MAG TPA: phytoene/squalene synthase family protein [Bacteroidales bacterium]|jgi:phytoene/squalene synthetase|nr:phytoene/squalene synthase family protein [Bacteroidales bacterium]MDI9574764.1 phytoene/squalene synthase family protein [Bacteroidota bacterium]OQC60999.1 MAG: Dehydrosqualene synthase [Bacteroidetes bacterium ADurb.Bin012]HNQ59461.1 phytoene/squalene synthase family protein [Bacteroidales bacterium]HNU21119.1 phytoene/squalene synthase family protein [Bacteroidales bacterium]